MTVSVDSGFIVVEWGYLEQLPHPWSRDMYYLSDWSTWEVVTSPMITWHVLPLWLVNTRSGYLTHDHVTCITSLIGQHEKWLPHPWSRDMYYLSDWSTWEVVTSPMITWHVLPLWLVNMRSGYLTHDHVTCITSLIGQHEKWLPHPRSRDMYYLSDWSTREVVTSPMITWHVLPLWLVNMRSGYLTHDHVTCITSDWSPWEVVTSPMITWHVLPLWLVNMRSGYLTHDHVTCITSLIGQHEKWLPHPWSRDMYYLSDWSTWEVVTSPMITWHVLPLWLVNTRSGYLTHNHVTCITSDWSPWEVVTSPMITWHVLPLWLVTREVVTSPIITWHVLPLIGHHEKWLPHPWSRDMYYLSDWSHEKWLPHP